MYGKLVRVNDCEVVAREFSELSVQAQSFVAKVARSKLGILTDVKPNEPN